MVLNIQWWRAAVRPLIALCSVCRSVRHTSVDFEIDVHGSPVTFPPARWLVCFVPGLKHQWWHPFANARHKHVFALRRLDDERWLLVEPWWTRLMVNVLTRDQAMKFLRWASAGDVLEVREAIPGSGSQARGWSNCAVLMSYMLGRSYWTWTPNGLYHRLRAEADTQHVHLSEFAAGFARIAANDEPADADEVESRSSGAGGALLRLEHVDRTHPAGKA